MKIFIEDDINNKSYKVSYHKCEEKNVNHRRLVIYKSFVIDHNENDEFGHLFLRIAERNNICECWRKFPNRNIKCVEITASEYKRIKDKR